MQLDTRNPFTQAPTERASLWGLRFIGAIALLLLACGDGDLEAASEKLRERKLAVDEARARVEARESEAKHAEEALARARADLATAEERLASARERVAKQANDALLFRNVQQRLLDDDELEGLAISARVHQRVVTLEGSVPSQKLKEWAEQIAGDTTGVESVKNQIRVGAAEP